MSCVIHIIIGLRRPIQILNKQYIWLQFMALLRRKFVRHFKECLFCCVGSTSTSGTLSFLIVIAYIEATCLCYHNSAGLWSYWFSPFITDNLPESTQMKCNVSYFCSLSIDLSINLLFSTQNSRSSVIQGKVPHFRIERMDSFTTFSFL